MGFKDFIRRLVNRGSSPEENLSSKTAKGTFWVSFLRIANRLVMLVRLIILARILSPEDFGIFGISLLVLSIINSISQTGYAQALIRKKESIEEYFDTTWTVQVIRGFLVAAVVFFLAGPASVFFGAPGAENMIRFIGLSFIIQSFTNVSILYFQKEFKFFKFFGFQFLSIVIEVIVTVTAAYILRNVWALVLGIVAGNLTKCIMSYIIEPYRPRFRLIKSQVRELTRFGKWVMGSGLLIFLIIQGDDIFVGSMLGATMLGFYQMAYRISNTTAIETILVIGRVSFPLYSKLQDSIPRLRKAYLKVLQLVALLSFPLAGLISVLAPEFTVLFLGEEWLPAVPAIQVLAFAGLMRSLINTTMPVFRAVGKPSIETRWQIIRLVIIIASIYPLTMSYGITGTSISILLSAFLSSIGFYMEVIRIIRCRVIEFAKMILLPMLNTAIISACVYFLKTPVGAASFPGFFILIAISIIIFFLVNYLFDRFLDYRIKRLIKDSISSFKM